VIALAYFFAPGVWLLMLWREINLKLRKDRS
jgi:hypothetical protein